MRYLYQDCTNMPDPVFFRRNKGIERLENRVEERSKKRMKRRTYSLIGTIALLVVGLGILLYPTFSDWWNTRRANSLITDIAQKKVNERVAEILLMLLDTFGTDREGFINVNLTRDDLSNIIGTATESVIRILRDFNSKDYIELKNKKIKINDYKRIKLISESI